MEKENLILLHGAIGSSAQLLPIAELMANDFKVFVLDFPCHGGEPVNESFSMDFFADSVFTFMNDNQISSAHIFGYSMGGYVALTMAKSHPERINSILTLGTKFDWNPESSIRESKMLNPEVIEEKVPKFAARLKELHSEPKWKDVLQETAKMMINLGNGCGLSDQDLANIKTKCTLGIGSKDTMVSAEETKYVANLLPNSCFVELAEIPHPIDLIDPEVIVNYIKDYIA